MRFPPEPLTTDECRRLIAACSPRCPTGLRNRGLIVTCGAAGCVAPKPFALHPRDLDNGVLRMRQGKGGKSRTVALDPEAWAVVTTWLERKARMGIGGPVFSTLHGEPLQPSYVRSLFKRLGSGRTLPSGCHPHGLRHTFAVALPTSGLTFASSNMHWALPAWAPPTLRGPP